MIRLLFAYLAGAVTVTAFVLATGGQTLTVFALGFFAAVLACALACRALGAARIASWLTRLAQNPRRTEARQQSARRSRGATSPAAPPSAVERDVTAALVNLGVGRQLAARAASSAKFQTQAQEFEPLFKAAVGLCGTGKVA